MKYLSTNVNSVVLEVDNDEIGILHYACYDYLAKICALKKNKESKTTISKLEQIIALLDRLI
jgi:hypothetical protein